MHAAEPHIAVDAIVVISIYSFAAATVRTRICCITGGVAGKTAVRVAVQRVACRARVAVVRGGGARVAVRVRRARRAFAVNIKVAAGARAACGVAVSSGANASVGGAQTREAAGVVFGDYAD